MHYLGIKMKIRIFGTLFVLFTSILLHGKTVEPSQLASLKELEWLVGNWEDKDEDTVIKSDWKWDENKVFLKQSFDVQVQGQKSLKGYQIVGWDPIAKKVRSWIFDSDGGFGEGSWSRLGDTWYNQIAFTIPSGQKASAINTYKKVDENTYTFGAINREIDGEILPNMDSVNIIKMAGGK